MAELKKTINNNYIIVSVGLLLGFLLGFVVLLANLPDYRSQSEVASFRADKETSISSFQFYDILPRDNKDALVDTVSRRKPQPERMTTRTISNLLPAKGEQ